MTTFILRAVSDHSDPEQQTSINFHYHPTDPLNIEVHVDHFRQFMHAVGVPEAAISRLFLNALDDHK